MKHFVENFNTSLINLINSHIHDWGFKEENHEKVLFFEKLKFEGNIDLTAPNTSLRLFIVNF